MSNTIIGKYYHKELGINYVLELKSEGIYVQKLFYNNKPFVNTGKFEVSFNTISLDQWKSREELMNTKAGKGGCTGCELKYRGGRLLYYEDPDNLPVDVFIKNKD